MKRLSLVLLSAAFACLPLLFGATVQAQQDGTMPETTTPMAAVTPRVTSRTAVVNGQTVGEVLVDDRVVFRLREPAGGYTVGQRADLIAARMMQQVNQGYDWQDVTVGRMNNQTVLLMGDSLLITVDQAHARMNGTTPVVLAHEWMGNTQMALRAGNPTTVVAGSVEEWPEWTAPDSKIVPIVSLGTPGLRLGFAQVRGPRERVDQVRAVLQLDLVFRRAARVRTFVPSSNLTGVNRVQGVAVSALLQYGLFQF